MLAAERDRQLVWVKEGDMGHRQPRIELVKRLLRRLVNFL